MEYIGYLLTIIIGIMLGLTGGGGSILAVPLLVYVFHIDPLEATSYSLGLVGITSLFALRPKYRAGLVDIKTGLLFAIPSLIGVSLVRQYLIPWIPTVITIGSLSLSKNTLIMLVFAVIMVLAAWSMIRTTSTEDTKKPLHTSDWLRYLMIMGEGIIVGGITGFVGAGGGFLIIPALFLLTKLPIKQAIGTSLLVISIKSLLGFVGDFGSINIDRVFFSIISIISIMGMFIGNHVQQFINESQLKRWFGYFVLIMGLFILIKEMLL